MIILTLSFVCPFPGSSGWDLCQMWALHRHRGRRHGPVHFLPGRTRKSMSDTQASRPSRGRSVLQPSYCSGQRRKKPVLTAFTHFSHALGVCLPGKADRIPAPESHRRQAPWWGCVCHLQLLRGDEQSCIFSLQHPCGGMPNCCKGRGIPPTLS